MKLRLLFLFLALVVAAPAAAQTKPLPACTMVVIPSTINKGESVTLKWTSTNATSANIPGPGLGAVSPVGQKNLIPVGSTRWVGTFTGPGGKATCSATVVVLRDGTPMTVFAVEEYEAGGAGAVYVNGPGTAAGPGTTNAPGTVGATGSLEGPGSVSAPSQLDGPGTLPAQQSATTPPNLPRVENPQLSVGKSGGIVPCGRPGDPGGSTGCQACHLAQLGQNIINFLIGLSIPLAAALFAYAGFLYFSASVVNKVEKARKIFTTVLIGFAIAVGGWLIVQTVLKTVLSEEYYLSWNKIECVANSQRQTDGDFKKLIEQTLPGLNTTGQSKVVVGDSQYTGSGFEGSYGCPPGATPLNGRCVSTDNPSIDMGAVSTLSNPTTCYAGDYLSGGKCMDSFGDTYDPFASVNSTKGVYGTCPSGYNYTEDAYTFWCQGPGGKDDWVEATERPEGAVAKGVAQWNERLYEACQKSGLSDCAVAQAIMTHESSGNPAVISRAGAAGLMQLLPTTACGMDRSISGCGTCQTHSDNTNGNCLDVITTLTSNPDLNMQLGTRELSRLYQRYNGNIDLIAAAYNGGDKANNASITCGGMTQWQCPVNSGYAETRKYVPRVSGTYNSLR